MTTEALTLLTRAEAAKVLRVGLRTLDGIVARGDLRPARIGGRKLVFRAKDVARYVDKSIRA